MLSPVIAHASGCYGGMGPGENPLDGAEDVPLNTHLYVTELGSAASIESGDVEWLDSNQEAVAVELIQIGEEFGGSYKPSVAVRPVNTLGAGTHTVEVGEIQSWDGVTEFSVAGDVDEEPPVLSGPLQLDAQYETDQSSCPDDQWIRATFPFPEDAQTDIEAFAYLVRLGTAPLDDVDTDSPWDAADLFVRPGDIDTDEETVSFRIGESMCGCIPPSWIPSEDTTYEIEIRAADVAGNVSADMLSGEVHVPAEDGDGESDNGDGDTGVGDGSDTGGDGGIDADDGEDDDGETEQEGGCSSTGGSAPSLLLAVALLAVLNCRRESLPGKGF